MRSSSEVLGNHGDGRSGMMFRETVYAMEDASKMLKSRRLLQVTSDSLSLSLSLVEQTEVSHRQEHVKTGANYFSMQWLVER